MVDKDELQESYDCPECGDIGSFGGVGVTDGASNWAGQRYRAMFCSACQRRYYVWLSSAPPSPS
jgi:hypothetical protein